MINETLVTLVNKLEGEKSIIIVDAGGFRIGTFTLPVLKMIAQSLIYADNKVTIIENNSDGIIIMTNKNWDKIRIVDSIAID